VYSDSWFIYPSEGTKYHESDANPDRQSCIECGGYNCYCRDDNCYDYSWDLFILDVAFFRREARIHYNQLNRYVFKQLLNLGLADASSRRFIADYFKYTLKNMPSQTSEIYRLGLKHMGKDDEQIPIEIENLNNVLSQHRRRIENMESDITKQIKRRCMIWLRKQTYLNEIVVSKSPTEFQPSDDRVQHDKNRSSDEEEYRTLIIYVHMLD
jgi:hypothetical protein